jgi:hypothetical protein
MAGQQAVSCGASHTLRHQDLGDSARFALGERPKAKDSPAIEDAPDPMRLHAIDILIILGYFLMEKAPTGIVRREQPLQA